VSGQSLASPILVKLEVAAVGTDALDAWPGNLVVLEATMLNGKHVLTARRPKQPAAPRA